MNLAIKAKEHGITDRDFLKCIVVDGFISAVMGRCVIDIIETDVKFGKYDKHYDPENSLYQGEKCSMSEYVEKKWGERHVGFIMALM